MILKYYEINKINVEKEKLILFYGNNEGLKKEEIVKLNTNHKKKVFKFDEKQVLDNQEFFYENLYSGSLFEDNKLIIIDRSSDKIIKIINELDINKLDKVTILINAGNLEKKSKLRAKFEKDKKHICVAFYPDTPETLAKLAQNFMKTRGILLSQMNINNLVLKCNGNREFLNNELEKIEQFSKTRKKISLENLSKIINLNENHSINELVDQCLAKNTKKIMNIINENNFNNDEIYVILRTFLFKLKKILILSKEFEQNKDINRTIENARPPIFWKEKNIIKLQLKNWTSKSIENLIFNTNKIELQIKKKPYIPLNVVYDFLIQQSSSNS